MRIWNAPRTTPTHFQPHLQHWIPGLDVFECPSKGLAAPGWGYAWGVRVGTPMLVSVCEQPAGCSYRRDVFLLQSMDLESFSSPAGQEEVGATPWSRGWIDQLLVLMRES